MYILSQHVYFNPSKSEIRGYYLVYPANHYDVGDIVLVCITDKLSIATLRSLGLPNKADGSCQDPYLLKRVAASMGDTVLITSNGISINDNLYPDTVAFTHYKNVLLNPLLVGSKYVLCSDEYFLLGIGTNSYDSRYFGVVMGKQIHYKAILLWNLDWVVR